MFTLAGDARCVRNVRGPAPVRGIKPRCVKEELKITHTRPDYVYGIERPLLGLSFLVDFDKVGRLATCDQRWPTNFISLPGRKTPKDAMFTTRELFFPDGCQFYE
ncbi:hypothetical protein EVAR_43546_1 [Eumeta japonica]|uniref:Uncharacterized protein n=1 Tax=Eumeta variegata TaxID=151549 RepID=A0A4C1WCL0_EUMVA|nr:hypothetical protein EVAR_43546_1 [Eumeta japonica]